MENALCAFTIIGGPIVLLFIGQAVTLCSDCRRHVKNGDDFRTAFNKANNWR